MISGGSGIGLVLLAGIGLVFSDQAWVRVLCGVVVGATMLGLVASVAVGDYPPQVLVVVPVMVAYVWFLCDLKRGSPEI
ncbi:MAG: hypothetical protein R6V05_13360 [Candidatus Brocadiia bacterium]